MKNSDQIAAANAWIRNGAVMGLVATLFYYGSALLPLPDRLQQFLALAFPGLLLCGHVGLYHWFNRQKHSALSQAALIFGICAPVLVSAMLCAQMSMKSYMDRFYYPLEQAAREGQINIWRATDSIQLGIDVAWDMFILPTIIMFAILAYRHLPFGKLMGSLGMVFGVGGFIFNVWTFPTPPIDVGLIDVGPFAMAWYAVLFVMVYRYRGAQPRQEVHGQAIPFGA